jgi:hypothetical protein
LLVEVEVHLHLAAVGARVDLELHRTFPLLLVQQLLSQLALVALVARWLHKVRVVAEIIPFFLLLPQQVVASEEFRVNLAAQELALVVLVALAAALVTFKA